MTVETLFDTARRVTSTRPRRHMSESRIKRRAAATLSMFEYGEASEHEAVLAEDVLWLVARAERARGRELQ